MSQFSNNPYQMGAEAFEYGYSCIDYPKSYTPKERQEFYRGWSNASDVSALEERLQNARRKRGSDCSS
jgi:hypothetical protein